MSIKRCYLCGGKLSEGRCVDCGLDNTRSERKTYRLNESYIEKRAQGHKIAEDSWDREDKNMKSRDANDKKVRAKEKETVKKMSADYKPAVTRTYQKAQRDGSYKQALSKSVMKQEKKAVSNSAVKIQLICAIIGVALVVVGPLTSFISSHKEEVQPVEVPIEETDPYEFAQRELSAAGDEYSIELEPGEYKVGSHLPEGNYQVLQLEGNGNITVDDYENSIYLWQSIGMDEENGELKEWIDVRLYQGAMMEVSGNLRVRMTTGNAQTASMNTMRKNPLSENILLEKGKSKIAGEDFPAGVYDFTSVGEWSSISYEIPLYTDYEDDSLNYLNRSKWVSADEIDYVCRNVVLPEGTVVCSEEADTILVPSEMIESEDYDSYYDEYR